MSPEHFDTIHYAGMAFYKLAVIVFNLVPWIALQLDAQKLIQIPLSEIEERLESKVSIMPNGLDKQLTSQQLADLVTFLKAAQ